MIGVFLKLSPTLSLFNYTSQNKLSDCGDESMVKYCSGINRCTTFCNLCFCKIPICAPDPVCQ